MTIRRECCNYCMWLGPVNQDGTMRKHRPAREGTVSGERKVQDSTKPHCPGSNKSYARFGCETEETNPMNDQQPTARTAAELPAGTRVTTPKGRPGIVGEINRGQVTDPGHVNYGREYVSVEMDPVKDDKGCNRVGRFFVDELAIESTPARFTVLNVGYVFIVRDTATELDAAAKSSRSGAQHIADCLADGTMVLNSLGRAVAASTPIEDPLAAVDFGEPRCVHGYVERPNDRGAAIKACDRKPPAVSVGVFSDEGCVAFFDCAVEASVEAARLNKEEGSPADEPAYRWAVLCADHAEQPKDGCEECATEGCGAVDAEDLDACGECSDCAGS